MEWKRSGWFSRTPLSPPQQLQGALREVNPPQQVPPECITAVTPLVWQGHSMGWRVEEILINLAGSGNIYSLLHLSRCIFSLGAMLPIWCENVYKKQPFHGALEEKSNFLLNSCISRVFEIYNIRLHLYFSWLREIRLFQKHNDSYSRWFLTSKLYRNTVLPLLLIYKLLYSPEVQSPVCIH